MELIGRDLPAGASRTACRSRPDGLPRAARARRTAGGRPSWRRAGSRRDRPWSRCDHLHHRKAEALPDAPTRAARLLAVQLQQVGLQHVHDLGERRIIGVDGDRDLLGAALHAGAELARRVKRHVARRGRKKHEPTMSAPASSATSRVSGVDRPQILTRRTHFSTRSQGDQPIELVDQRIERVLDDIGDDFKIDVPIAVNDDVAQS